MKDCIKEYSDAIQENLDAQKALIDCKIRQTKAHYRLLKAKEEMHAKEREIMEEQLQNYYE